jgi:hypothetical protein
VQPLPFSNVEDLNRVIAQRRHEQALPFQICDEMVDAAVYVREFDFTAQYQSLPRLCVHNASQKEPSDHGLTHNPKVSVFSENYVSTPAYQAKTDVRICLGITSERAACATKEMDPFRSPVRSRPLWVPYSAASPPTSSRDPLA